MPEVENFGERLKELRSKAGLTQLQLATKAGLKLGAVRDLEQGVNQPRWKTVVVLSRALGVSCEAFLEAPAGAEG